MSTYDDYIDEMSGYDFSDADVERLLRGETPEHPQLMDLTRLVEQLRIVGSRYPSPEVARAQISAAAALAREAIEIRPRKRPKPLSWLANAQSRLAPRLATALAAFILLIGMTGVSLASNGAVPGDPLYGLDMALEKVGIMSGGIAERVEEAEVLLGRGLAAQALTHLGSASDDHVAADALLGAAQRLQAKADESDSIQDQSSVAALLNWIATNDPKSAGFGQTVAEMARELGGGKPDEEPAGSLGKGKANQGNGNGKGRGQSS